jgi:rSAM/selenodomain-associated transferase 2
MSVAPVITDRAEHAESVRTPASSASARKLSIGIVVPVLNEAAILELALMRLKAIAPSCPVIVVDGGSADGSAEIARRHFPTAACPAANRGAQMNQGARVLSADILLFLHADSALPDGFEAQIEHALADPRVVAGCFRLRFDSERTMLRLYSWCTQFPGRFLHFGDQGFFFRREAFERLNGYRELPFMEDADILRRLRAPGFLGLGRRLGKFVVLPAAVTTSARRFLQTGIVRQQLVNILIVTLFELGVSARRLARLYPNIR